MATLWPSKKKRLKDAKVHPALIWSAQTVAKRMDFFLSSLLFVPKYWLKYTALSRN
jgi:hypothetical protein